MMMATAIAAFTFTACEDVPAPYDLLAGDDNEVVVIEPSGSGTQADPYNVAAILEIVSAMEADQESNEDYFIHGFVTSIKENFDGSHGNAEFNIADDTKGSNKFTIYRAKYLGNKSYTKGAVLKIGDEVVVHGKVVNFKGSTFETANGKAYLYSLNGNTEASDTPDTPVDAQKVTVAQFNAAAESNDVWYQLTGTVKNLKDGDIYGNFDLDDGTGSVYVYGLLAEKGGEAKKFQELAAAKGIKNGCKITIIGNRGSYTNKTTGEVKIEVMNAFFVSVEAGDTPEQPAEDVGSLDAPKTVAEALAAANALGDNETTTANWYIKGKVTRKANTENEIGPNSEKKYKDMNYYIADDDTPGVAPVEIYVYRGKYLDGADFTSFDQLNEGDEVIIYGQLQKYIDTKNNNAVTPEVKNSKIVKLNGQGGGNNENPEEPTNETTFGVLQDNILTLDCAGLNITGDLTTITLVDGTTITFDKNDGRNAPIYNQSFGEFRLYARNSMTINGGNKTIYGVKFYCTTNNGTPCRGNENELTGTGDNFSIDAENNTIEFIRVENNVFTVTNAFAEKNSGGVQLRFNKLEITFW